MRLTVLHKRKRCMSELNAGCCSGNSECCDSGETVDPNECCAGCCTDAVDVFPRGTVVVSVLTGRPMMVLDSQLGNPTQYMVRTDTYEQIAVFDFEVREQ
jgi:hypothetical protein